MDYKNTVFLPKTDFAMKANLAARELEFVNYWRSIDLYKTLRAQSEGRPSFMLHFGPPYANGHIHMGHALSEVLKDIINKTFQMKGYNAPMVPGWDCHGLPIEWKIEEHFRAKGVSKEDVPFDEFVSECRQFAKKWMDTQREEFIRLGIIADFENPYVTMDFNIEAAIVEKLMVLAAKDVVYRGLKPVMWSVVEKTALAEAEVEYHEHTSDSIFVAFPITQTKNPHLEDVSAVIWTTTPWTIPGNRAIAYGPEIEYEIVRWVDLENETLNNRKFLVARNLVKSFAEALGAGNYEVVGFLKGDQLEGTICAHPWRGRGYDFEVPMLPGDHVTTEAGTGLVHTAPGHGLEDFALGLAFDIEVPATVGDDGVYYNHVPLVAGEHIYKVNPKVIDLLGESGCLLHAGKITHSYPHSWRSKTPLIYRATAQWFVDMDQLRSSAMKAIDEVNWFPAQGKNRISAMVEGRPDWCISRQRSWGVPITLFVNRATGDILKDDQVNQRILEAIRTEGVEAWTLKPTAYFLGGEYNPEDFEKVTDILDVWFDSGCSHEYVLKNRPELSWPADVYFEGSDQHRGWFQSSLLVSCALNDKAPYKNVVTHGFVLDEKGYKMSKSQGNTVSPQQIMNTMGADILRLWIVNCDYTEDLRIGQEILKHQEDIYRRFRNTLRYLLGALDGFSETEIVPYEDMPDLEKLILHRLSELSKEHQDCLATFTLSPFYMALHTFCAVDLSAFFFDIRKDSLYCDSPENIKRRATRTVMHHVLGYLLKWLAPVLSFTAEEAFQALTQGNKGSIHGQLFEVVPAAWHNNSLNEKWQKIRQLRKVMTSALEIERAAKTIGSSLQAHMAVYVDSHNAQLLKDIDLDELAITSSSVMVVAQPPAGAVTLDEIQGIGVVVTSAEGGKCARCWRVLPEVMNTALERKHNELCHRCEEVVIG
jgi:isoleucyl-tRNA synthetase